MTVYSYHGNKSTGIGGIESLTREFHKNLKDLSFIELYNSINGEDLFSNPSGSLEKKLVGGRNSIMSKFLAKISLFLFFFKMNKGDILIVYSPAALLSIPFFYLYRNKVVVVQANSIDKVFCLTAKLAMLLYSRLIDVYSVYTNQDKIQLLNVSSLDSSVVRVIPRGCRITTALHARNFSNRLVTIARVDEKQKNFTDMLKIMKKLGDEYSLDIYGSGEKSQELWLESEIESTSNVRFMGVAEDVRSILNDYSVFIITSHYEGFGQTLIEARSQGLPIVGYNSYPSFDWIVKDGLNGSSIEPYNISGFCEAIHYITSSNDIFNGYSISSLSLSSETELSVINSQWRSLLIGLLNRE